MTMAVRTTILDLLNPIATMLGIQEPPVETGYRRVRWTCWCCGEQLWDDYKELVPGALDELQACLGHSFSSAQHPPSLSYSDLHEESTTAAGSRSNDAHQPDADHIGTSTGTPGVPPSIRNRRLGTTQSAGLTGDRDVWVYGIFEINSHTIRLVQLKVPMTTLDLDLFWTLRKEYFAQSSRFSRFLSMRALQKISVAYFVHAPIQPDVRYYDRWPAEADCPPWKYVDVPGCSPNVGSKMLMHLWQNARHLKTPTEGAGTYRPPTGISPQGIEHGTINDRIPTSTTTRVYDHRAYNFLRLPKKAGGQLKTGALDPDQAWGIYFHEGFQLPYLVMIILFLHTLGGLAFGVYWSLKYGFVAKDGGASAWGVAAWSVGWVGLCLNVWIKRVESVFW